MRKMKKATAFLLAFVLIVLPLVSCGDESESTTAPPDTDPIIDYTELPYSEVAGEISLFGVPLSEYRIVIPTDCDLYTRYAAKNIVDYLKANAGITLEVVTDSTKPRERELLVGATNREGSVTAAEVSLESDEYILMRSEDSVVIYGEGYMVGGAASALLNRHAAAAWRGFDVDVNDIPTAPEPKTFVFLEARNAVYIIADGFGDNHVDAALAGGLDHFAGLDLPNIGSVITESLSVIEGKAKATDSAAGGTALATGYKTYNGYIGVDGEGNPVPSLRELANSVGAKTSLLTTDPQTATTISSFLVHINDRDKKDEIARLQSDVIARGEVDLVRAQIGDAIVSEAANHLYSVSAHGSRFFSMLEEGAIDSKSHDNDLAGVVHTVTRLHELISYSLEFVLMHPDTVLVITADHETGRIAYDNSRDRYVFLSKSHSNLPVPIYAIGRGTEIFNGVRVDNVDIPKFIAKIYGDDGFGQ